MSREVRRTLPSSGPNQTIAPSELHLSPWCFFFFYFFFLKFSFQLKGGKERLSLHFDLIKLEPSEADSGTRQEVYGGVSKMQQCAPDAVLEALGSAA